MSKTTNPVTLFEAETNSNPTPPPELEPGFLKPNVRRYLYIGLLVAGLLGLVVLPTLGKVAAILLLVMATALLLRLETLLLVTLALIPLHGAMTLLVFNLGPAEDLRALRVAQAWKEILVAIIIARIIWQHYRVKSSWRALLNSIRPAPGKRLFNFVDLAVIFFVAMNFFFLVLVPTPFTLYTRLQSLRYQIFFLALYFIGRAIIPSTRLKPNLLKVCLWAGGITAFGAIAERFLTIEQFTQGLKASEYFTALFGAGAFAKDIQTDLPAFFTNSCGFQRSGSFMLAPLDVAHQFLFTIVVGIVGTVGVFQSKLTSNAALKRIGMIILVLIMGTGLALAYSRAAIILIIFEMALVSFLLAKGKLRFVLPVVVVATSVLLLYLSLDVGGRDWKNCLSDTVSGRESSVTQHSTAISESFRATLFNPFGFGVGSSGSYLAGDSDFSGIGGESAYAITAVQLGVIGWLGLVMLVVTPLLFWFFSLINRNFPDKALPKIGLVYFAAMAFLLVSTQPWVFGFATWMAWLLTGLCVSQSLQLVQNQKLFNAESLSRNSQLATRNSFTTKDTEVSQLKTQNSASPDNQQPTTDNPIQLATRNSQLASAFDFLQKGSLSARFGYKAAGSLVVVALLAAVLALFFGQRIPTNVVFSRLGPITLNVTGNADAVRSFPMRLRYDNDYLLTFKYKATQNKPTNFRICMVLRDNKTNPTDALCYEDNDGEGKIATGQQQSGQIQFRTRAKTYTGEVYIINKGEVKLEVERIQIIKLDQKEAR